MKDDLGDRMKAYEAVTAQRRLDPTCPTVARIDGRSFSKFTKGFVKPFDRVISNAMDATTSALVKNTHADIGYVQSDEITLIWREQEDDRSSMFFDWREQKLVSVLASMAAAEFNWSLLEQLSQDPRDRLKVKTQMVRPHFDCRVWSVPDRGEAANTLLWRAQDARRNAISSFAQQHVSHKGLQGLNQEQMLRAAYENGARDIHMEVSQDDLNGRYFQRVVEDRQLTEEEWLTIPEGNRPPRAVTYTRSSVKQLETYGYLGDVPHENRIGAIFK